MAQERLRFGVLDGWRGICAVLVALYHLNVASVLLDNGFVRHSYLFVDFFFVLSGFVITHTYWGRIDDGDDTADFAIRRFARVWPLHAALLLAFVAVEALKAAATAGGVMSFPTAPFTGPNALDAIGLNLTMQHAFGLSDGTSWNFPSWSIAAEFWTYLVFAVLAWFAMGGQIRRAGAIALAAAIVGLSFAVLIVYSPRGMDATYDFGFVRCLYGFFIGHFTYRLWRRARGRGSLPPAVEIAALGVAILFVPLAGGTPAALFAPLVFASVVFVFAFEAGPASRLMRTKAVTWLGERSYSIYMVHAFVAVNLVGRPAQIAEKLTGIKLFLEQSSATGLKMLAPPFGEIGALTVIALYIAIVLAVAALTYRFIEIPAQRLILQSRKRAAAQAAAQAASNGLYRPAGT